MRYKLDVNGYVIAVSFGCYLDGCTEYTGTIPIGYNSLEYWATYSCVNAYYIDDSGNLALDQEKLAEIRRKEAQEKVDNAPVIRKDLYESEEVLESQYIKATVTGQAINLTDAKVLPPRIKLTDVNPSAYSELILYVSNDIDTREYTILLDGLETVDYIVIEKGLAIASANGTEQIIGEGHIRLFEGVCNIYASEVVTIEIEYSTNVQDVDSLEFLQGKATATNRFKICDDGSIEAHNGKFSGEITASSFGAKGTIVKYASDYTDADVTIARNLVDGKYEITPEYLERYDFDCDGLIGGLDYLKVVRLATNEVESYTIENEIEINPCNDSNILKTKGVSIRSRSVFGETISGETVFGKQYKTIDDDGTTKQGVRTGFPVSGQRRLEVSNGIVTGFTDGNHNILWSGACYMNSDHTIPLNSLVSAQVNGIVLVFSPYDSSTETPLNYDFVSHFVSSWLVEAFAGTGHNFLLVDSGMNYIGNKYLYIHDSYIVGHSINVQNGTNSSVTINRKLWVLRYVIGV